ncbi:unannotated protein [freshwater metagenome]|uniref:Unannotated protein n=1 Tax=freshwater metagenome TaxID=449393 RepID=A0A6J7KPF1_9ZZZZ
MSLIRSAPPTSVIPAIAGLVALVSDIEPVPPEVEYVGEVKTKPVVELTVVEPVIIAAPFTVTLIKVVAKAPEESVTVTVKS